MSTPAGLKFDNFKNKEPGSPALIFDVEGTFVDCVRHTLESWPETLADLRFKFSVEQLHPFSGMDGAKRGKLHPDLDQIALQRLAMKTHAVVSVGDTPYDASAAGSARFAQIIATLTGGFPPAILREALRGLIVESAADLTKAISPIELSPKG